MKGERLGWILVLAGGVVLGYYTGLHRGSARARSIPAGLASPPSHGREPAGANQSPLPASTATATPQATASPATARGAGLTPIEKLQVLSDLQQRKLVTPALVIIDRQGRLDDAFAGLFALTPQERDRLQRALDDAREKLAALERANATVTRDPNGKIVVAVQPFPSEGGRIYDETMQVFADVLGPGRNDAYRTMGAEQLEKSLGGFGAAERTYTFGYESNDRPGQPYTLRDEVRQRTPNGVNNRSNTTAFRSYAELSAYVGPVVSILPPEFRKDR